MLDSLLEIFDDDILLEGIKKYVAEDNAGLEDGTPEYDDAMVEAVSGVMLMAVFGSEANWLLNTSMGMLLPAYLKKYP